MRAWVGAVTAAAVLLVSCRGGGRAADRSEPVTSTAPPTSAPAGPSTTSPSPAPAPSDPPGSVTLRLSRFSLPPGGGMRVLVRAATPRLTVRRKGGGGSVSVCATADAGSPVDTSRCADLGAERVVEVGSGKGVEIRAADRGVSVEEVAVSYVAVDRSMTLVTPARPAGSCSVTACEAAFSLSPARAGPFSLDGRAGGGQPRLVLEAVGAPGGGSRVLATAQGGGFLSLRATLEPSAEAVVLYREQGEGPVGALTMEILWP